VEIDCNIMVVPDRKCVRLAECKVEIYCSVMVVPGRKCGEVAEYRTYVCD
jgi:hypothetical protein